MSEQSRHTTVGALIGNKSDNKRAKMKLNDNSRVGVRNGVIRTSSTELANLSSVR